MKCTCPGNSGKNTTEEDHSIVRHKLTIQVTQK